MRLDDLKRRQDEVLAKQAIATELHRLQGDISTQDRAIFGLVADHPHIRSSGLRLTLSHGESFGHTDIGVEGVGGGVSFEVYEPEIRGSIGNLTLVATWHRGPYFEHERPASSPFLVVGLYNPIAGYTPAYLSWSSPQDNEALANAIVAALDGRRPEHELRPVAVSRSDSPARSGCFVASHVYGSPTHPDVLLLQMLRDRFLLRSVTGRALVATYYIASPHLIRMMPAGGLVSLLLRQALLRPLARLGDCLFTRRKLNDHTVGDRDTWQ